MKKPVYLPFTSGKWRLSLGLKALPLKDWIQIDQEFVPYLQRKAELRQTHYAQVFGTTTGSETAQQEVLDALLHHLLHYFPDHYQLRDGVVTVLPTGDRWFLADFATAPLDLAGRLVQEDLCLLLPGRDGYTLRAASLSFPLYWQLQDKLGKAIAAIHDPVPGYAQSLQQPVNTYFDRLQDHAPGYRFNWSITDTPDLFLGHDRVNQVNPTHLTPENAGDRLWIRVERQTFRRFPQSQGVLFGIRTYLYPLAILKHYPHAAVGLTQVMQEMPPALQLYKSLLPIREVLFAYVQQSCRLDVTPVSSD